MTQLKSDGVEPVFKGSCPRYPKTKKPVWDPKVMTTDFSPKGMDTRYTGDETRTATSNQTTKPRHHPRRS